MEAQMQNQEYADTTSTEATTTQINNQSGTLAKLPPASDSQEWQQYGAQVSQFLADLPDYLGKFFNSYKQPIISLGLIFAAIIAVKVVLAVLDALNDIPLLAPTFELVGIGYSTWFVYRYLLKASTREELADEIQSIKGDFVGKQLPEAKG